MVLKKSTSPLQLCHIVVFSFGLFFFLLRFAVRLPARTRRGASASLLPVHSCGEVWDLLTAPVIPSSFVSLTPHCPRGPSNSLDLNPAHQILHNKWSQVRLTYSALPLLPTPRSHRSARCIGICSPNHGCDTGQSRAQKHTHRDPDARTHPRWGIIYLYTFIWKYIFIDIFSHSVCFPHRIDHVFYSLLTWCYVTQTSSWQNDRWFISYLKKNLYYSWKCAAWSEKRVTSCFRTEGRYFTLELNKH